MNVEQRNGIESFRLRRPPDTLVGWSVDYFTGKLAGFNLLLVVDPEGSIIGFHNVWCWLGPVKEPSAIWCANITDGMDNSSQRVISITTNPCALSILN